MLRTMLTIIFGVAGDNSVSLVMVSGAVKFLWKERLLHFSSELFIYFMFIVISVESYWNRTGNLRFGESFDCCATLEASAGG